MEDTVAIKCETTGKLLARRDVKGIYLWCRECKTEHFIPWNSEEQNSDEVASQADLCYNLGR